MDFVGSIHKSRVKEWQAERKNERDQFIQETSKFIFGILHMKLEMTAATEEFNLAAQLSIDSARKLAFTLFPDLTDKELQEMWNKYAEGN